MSKVELLKSSRLNNLSYAIRGPLFDKAQELESEGTKIINLNIGNPAPFGFNEPDEVKDALKNDLDKAQAYSHHLGIVPARQAVCNYMESIGAKDISIQNVFLGNGVSELIMMSMLCIINEGDEILIPSPDYPIWTTSVALYGGKPIHYNCDEENDWNPDIEDIRKKITLKTKGIVIINPNNPTGAVYEKRILNELLQIAEEYDLIVFSDEIYDQIVFDDSIHYPISALSNEVLILTYGGLSKNYKAAGFRAGWMVLSGKILNANSILEGMNLLASMRLCSNVPSQFAIKKALEGNIVFKNMAAAAKRLFEQRDMVFDLLSDIDGITCSKPKGALYIFPKIDLDKFDFVDDEDFALKLLIEKQILLVPGSGFNLKTKDHFRIVFLPEKELLKSAINSLREFLIDHLVSVQKEITMHS